MHRQGQVHCLPRWLPSERRKVCALRPRRPAVRVLGVDTSLQQALRQVHSIGAQQHRHLPRLEWPLPAGDANASSDWGLPGCPPCLAEAHPAPLPLYPPTHACPCAPNTHPAPIALAGLCCSVCPTAASAAELGAAAHALLASGWWAPSVSSASTTAPVCRARNSIGTIGTIRMIRGGWAAASAHLTGSVAWPVGTITTAFKRSASRWELMLPLAVHPGPPWLGRSQQQPLVMGMPWASQHNCRRHG